MHTLIVILTVFKAIFIPVQCQDSEFSCTREELSATLLQAQEYFNRETGRDGGFEFRLGNVVNLDRPTAFYGHNSTSRKDELLYKGVMEACMKSEGIDFGEYDNDGDSEVDNVYLIMAGSSEIEGVGEDFIWPHRYFINDCGETFSIDGKRINSYAVSTESGGLRYLCHEFGHVLGLPDLYDTDGELSGGVSYALGGTCLMEDKLDRPVPLCAVEKEILGIGKAVIAEKGHYSAEDGCRYVLNTLTEGNCYLLERVAGKGIAIYHVDRSASDAGYSDYYRKNLTAAQRWELNEVNCNPKHQCAQLMGFFPSDGCDSFCPEDCPLAISDITADGFNVIEPISIIAIDEYQDAAIVRWKALHDVCSISMEGGDQVEIRSDDGMFSYTFEHLRPASSYVIEIRNGSFNKSAGIRTKAYNSNVRAYIHLTGAERTVDGAFVKGTAIPLRVYNAPDAVSVRWTFDGKEISCGKTGYYTLDRNGELRARIEWDDGSIEIITKTITVR